MKKTWLLPLCMVSMLCIEQVHASFMLACKNHKRWSGKERVYRSHVNKFGLILGEIGADALLLHRYLFTVNSAKVFTATVPFYLITRQFDENIQSNFYDPCCHKNINQLPKHCYSIAKNGVGVPMALLSTMILWGPTQELRQTARMYAIGLPFVHSGKTILKKISTKACLRPWNELYSSKKRASGGFPSGHIANVAYAATLFGMRHGIAWALPLSLLGLFVFGDFISCNRHYTSQLVAGAGLGVMYAFAANAVIERKITKQLSCNVGVDAAGRSTFNIAYNF